MHAAPPPPPHDSSSSWVASETQRAHRVLGHLHQGQAPAAVRCVRCLSGADSYDPSVLDISSIIPPPSTKQAGRTVPNSRTPKTPPPPNTPGHTPAASLGEQKQAHALAAPLGKHTHTNARPSVYRIHDAALRRPACACCGGQSRAWGAGLPLQPLQPSVGCRPTGMPCSFRAPGPAPPASSGCPRQTQPQPLQPRRRYCRTPPAPCSRYCHMPAPLQPR